MYTPTPRATSRTTDMADADTFNFRGKVYAVNRFALTPPGKRGARKVIDLNRRAAADLRRKGFAVEIIGGIPTFAPARLTPIEVVNGARMVRSPLSHRLIPVDGPAYRRLLRNGYEYVAAPDAGPADAPPGYLRLREAVNSVNLTGFDSMDAFRQAVREFFAAHPASVYRIRLANGVTFAIPPPPANGNEKSAGYHIVERFFRQAGVGSERASWEDVEAAILGNGAGFAAVLVGAIMYPSKGIAPPTRQQEDQDALYAAADNGECVKAALTAWDPESAARVDWAKVGGHLDAEAMQNVAETAGITIRVWSQALEVYRPKRGARPAADAPGDAPESDAESEAESDAGEPDREELPYREYRSAGDHHKGKVCHLWHQFNHVVHIASPPSIKMWAGPEVAPTIVRGVVRKATRVVYAYATPEDEARAAIGGAPSYWVTVVDHGRGIRRTVYTAARLGSPGDEITTDDGPGTVVTATEVPATGDGPEPIGEEVVTYDEHVSASEVLAEMLAEIARVEPVRIVLADPQPQSVGLNVGQVTKSGHAGPVVKGLPLVALYTRDKLYKAATFEAIDAFPHCWSNAGAAWDVFTKDKGCPVKQGRFREFRASDIVPKAITYQAPGGADLTPEKAALGLGSRTGYAYDIIGAYRNAQLSPYFTGFPLVRGPRRYVAWDPLYLDPARGFEGLAIVETDADLSYSRHPATVFASRRSAAPFPLVRYAMARGEQFRILGALVSARDPSDILARVKEVMRGVRTPLGDSVEKPAVNALIGRWWSSSREPMHVATSDDERKALEAAGLSYVRSFGVGEGAVYVYKAAATVIDRDYPEGVAYIHAFTRIAVFADVIDRLPAIGLSWANVRRIWCDGVTLDTELPPGFLDEKRWRSEGKKEGTSPACEPPTAATIAIPKVQPMPTAYNLQPLVAIIGPPGSGKTHQIAQWSIGETLRLTATTRCAANLLKSRLPADAEAASAPTTVQALLQEIEVNKAAVHMLASSYDRLVVDEFTMLTYKQLCVLVDMAIPLLLSGDFRQLGAVIPAGVEDRQIGPGDLIALGFRVFDLEDPEQNPGCRNYRADDPVTAAFYQAARAADTVTELADAARAAGIRFADAVPVPKVGERAHYVTSLNTTVREQNRRYCREIAQPGAAMVTFGDSEEMRITEPFTPGMQLIAVSNFDDPKSGKELVFNQETLTAVEYRNKGGRGKKACIAVRKACGTVVEVPAKVLYPGYAITFHRVQGQTYSCPIAVDLAGVFERNAPYVGVTRSRLLSQLTVVGAPLLPRPASA